MKLPSMQTLQKIALYTGAVGLTAAVLVQLNRQEKVAESPYFREAFKVLRAHEGNITVSLDYMAPVFTNLSFCRSKEAFRRTN